MVQIFRDADAVQIGLSKIAFCRGLFIAQALIIVIVLQNNFHAGLRQPELGFNLRRRQRMEELAGEKPEEGEKESGSTN